MAPQRFRKLFYLVILAFACGRAYVGDAHAQFSFPYDPDFAEEEPAPRPKARRKTEPRPGPAPSPEAEPDEPRLPDWIKNAGPFLLMPREKPEQILPRDDAEPREADFYKFLLNLDPFSVDQKRWNRMRDLAEKGQLPTEEIEVESAPAEPFEIAIATVAPKPPTPEVELPTYGTSLSITGRKTIGFNFSEKRFTSEQTTTGRPASTNNVDIDQQLQLRMQGKVGPKITVNVDYDDTKENKQDISVVYNGDSQEVVQNAAFGDIDLSLPSTEFVSYNKQLFGIRVDLKFKKFKATFVGSRTKGQTKSKQFKGGTQFITQDILDINYIRRRYYDLSFGDSARLPIQVGSERIFLARSAGGQQNVNEVTLTVDDLNVNTSTFTGNFVELSPGIDYTVDYVDGIITFRNTLDASDVVAVQYTDATGSPITVQRSTNSADGVGGTGNFKLIKTFADVAISTSAEAGFQRELKTFYNLGRSQIVRDNGRGNFFLRVLDQNRNIVGPNLNPLQIYPDTIEVDFEQGIFQLDQPFGTSATDSTEDPEIYSPTPITKRLFQVEFRFRVKTFFLEPNLVLQSEIVLIDGIRLTRNVDYFIDYESGFLTFFNEERIQDDSTVDVTYEVAPFAGNASESLIGGRISYQVLKNWSVGSTLLFQTGSRPQNTPTINELAQSLLVYEADTQLSNIRILPWLKASFAAEVAQSVQNPNLSKQAFIDNMEGVKQDDAASLQDTFWRVSTNPDEGPPDPTGFTLQTIDEQVLVINPGAPANEGDTQKVLTMSYDFGVAGSTEVSAVFPFSPTGLDFTQKTLLEITLLQTTQSDNDINFRLGGVNEDFDGDAVLDTEDVGEDGVANTNDSGELDGILQPNEDIGYLYNPAGKNSTRYGAGNGIIDSEDLNQNNRLDSADFSGDDFGYVGSNTELFDATSGSTRTFLDFDGSQYHTFQIPLTIPTTDFARWVAIKQVRVTVRQRAGGSNSGEIRLARVAVVGNTWQRGQAGDPSISLGASAGEALTVNAVNNVDNAEYVGREIFNSPGEAQDIFNTLYGSVEELQQDANSSNISEQSLELRYRNLTSGTTVFSKRVFPRAIDISQHKKFNFLLFGNSDETSCASGGVDLTGEKEFFMRAGSETDFFEIRVPINFCGWRKISVNQVDLTGDQIPDDWTVAGAPTGSVVRSSGAPNLQQIGALFAGIESKGNTKNTAAVYVNEIHVADPLTRTGTAAKLQADFVIPGWATFGAKTRFIDRNYQTPTRLVSNQDDLQQSAYVNLTKLSWFPMQFNLNFSKITTPNTNAVGDRQNTVSLLQQGTIRTWSGSATGNFSYKSLPRANLSYTRNRIDYETSTRLDDNQTYKGNVSYGVPFKLGILPRTIDANASQSTSEVIFRDPVLRQQPENFNTRERTRMLGVRMAFEPWRGSSFNPTYSLTLVNESRTSFDTGSEVLRSYDKSLNQQVGFTSSWRITKWLKPQISYNISTIENNILNGSTFTLSGSTFTFDIGEIKTINRTANGNISLSLSVAELFPKTKLFRSFSLTNGYQLQDGDVWNNVESGLDSKMSLWVRTPLRPTNSVAERQTLTLRDTFNSTQRWSPLEGYKLKGRLRPLKTFSLTNNYVKSIQRSETTNTPSKTISTTLPDIVASMTQLEELLYAERWMKNMQLNFKFAKRNTTNVGISKDSNDSFGTDLRAIIRKKYDTSLSFNVRQTVNEDLRIGQVTQTVDHMDATLQSTFDLGKFRFTSKVDYSTDQTTLGTGVKTQDVTVLTPSLLIRTDLSLPKGLYLPVVKRTLKFTNRIVWTNTLSFQMRNSDITLADNTRTLTYNTNADYEIAKNLRMTLNGSFSRLFHKFLKEEEFISYQLGSTLTFQF